MYCTAHRSGFQEHALYKNRYYYIIIDSPEHAVGDKEDVEVAGDVQGEGDGRPEGDGKPEGDKEQPEGVQKVEDMPSFEEWKQQMLDKQQAEMVEKTKHRE